MLGRAFFTLMYNGGETGIRTLGRQKPTTVFETVAFGHSAISPKDNFDFIIYSYATQFSYPLPTHYLKTNKKFPLDRD